MASRGAVRGLLKLFESFFGLGAGIQVRFGLSSSLGHSTNRRLSDFRTTVVDGSPLAESVPPNPGDLIESLRDFGYTLPSALADLIDNSLAADARRINITVDPASASPHIAVLDDGKGMSQSRLIEAMRMAACGPFGTRSTSDLGRFGLGMKTASLSQGQCLTVISKHNRSLSLRSWDLAHVRRTKEWQLLSKPTDAALPYYEKLTQRSHGTAIVIEKLDRVSISRPADLASALDSIRGHLGMVFHRFIDEDNLEIRLGDASIPSWDPYLLSSSTRLATETLRLGTKGQIKVQPFVLPHHSHITDDQHQQGAGPLGWNAHQGFYIYRCRRLIVPGTWLNLRLKKEEHFKLARIRVDLPNTMDHDWQLNVMKSHVSAPTLLKDDFRRIASDVRRQASAVYRIRGDRVAPKQDKGEHFVWRREATRTGVTYRLDRKHPVLQALLNAGCVHDEVLSSVVSLIESTIPVAAMLQEPQKAIDGAVTTDPPVNIDALIDMLIHAEHYFIRTGKSPADARKCLLVSEPFVRFKDALTARLEARTRTAAEKAT